MAVDSPSTRMSPEPPTRFELTASRQFTDWLAAERVSLAFTTYQTGKLFLLGLQPDGRLSTFERTFSRCMGLWSNGQTMWMSSLFQLWRFENVLPTGGDHEGYDRLYVPQQASTTGDLDIHDVVVEEDGRVVFANTLFNCLATTSETNSFRPLWHPPFISRLAAEDRCHLNGVASEEGRVRYVTTVARSDVADGWRDRRASGGCVVDVTTGEVVVEGLSMPHSPRLHQGRLWLLNSGTGFLGSVDLSDGTFEPLAFCPGYARGLAMVGNYAVVGLSGCRANKTFAELELDRNLASRDAEPRCGLLVIDLRSGDTVHWLRLDGVVQELYDVVVLPGVHRPMALGLKTDEIRRLVSVGEAARLGT